MEKIAELRKKTGMSQSEFSRRYGLPVRTLQRWEQGQNVIPDYTFSLLKTVIEHERVSDEVPTLPERFRYAFWDTDFSRLNVLKDREFIIARLFTKGGMQGIKWVTDNYSAADIELAARNRRDLDPIVANYLKDRCGLEKSDMKYYRMGVKDWR